MLIMMAIILPGKGFIRLESILKGMTGRLTNSVDPDAVARLKALATERSELPLLRLVLQGAKAVLIRGPQTIVPLQ